MVMKKLAGLVLVVLVILVWLFWPKPTPLYPQNGTNIVLFGDSLAAGKGASADHDIASLLGKAIGEPVINLGVSGNTTADGLERLDELLATDPKIVIIILGGNDTLRRVPIEQTFSNLEKLIIMIQKTGAAVILVGEPGGLYGSRYADEYERLAETYRTFYVPNILSGLIGHPEYMSDYVHPNDVGYEIAGKKILPVLKEALSGENN